MTFQHVFDASPLLPFVLLVLSFSCCRMVGEKGADGKRSPVICTALTGVGDYLNALSYAQAESTKDGEQTLTNSPR